MKVFYSVAMAIAVSFASMAQAEVALAPAADLDQENGVELSYDAAAQDLTITYRYMQNNSCPDQVRNLKIKDQEISFNLRKDPAHKFCLMVISEGVATVQVKGFRQSAKLKINGQELGVIRLKGDTVSFDQGELEPTPAPVSDNENIGLSYDANAKVLKLSYSYINSNSCLPSVARVASKASSGNAFGEVSFNLVSRGNQMCLMVITPATAEVSFENFIESSALVVDGATLGWILLSDDGKTVSFESNHVITLPPVGAPQ